MAEWSFQISCLLCINETKKMLHFFHLIDPEPDLHVCVSGFEAVDVNRCPHILSETESHGNIVLQQVYTRKGRFGPISRVDIYKKLV